jgi:hypothetical protein
MRVSPGKDDRSQGAERVNFWIAVAWCPEADRHVAVGSAFLEATFGQLRRLRRLHHRRPARLDPDADIRRVLDEDEPPEGFVHVSAFRYVGRGYLSTAEAAEAVRSAALSRIRSLPTQLVSREAKSPPTEGK